MGATAGKPHEESLISAPASESSGSRPHRGGLRSLRTASFKAGKKLALRRWRNRKQQAQLFGVVRHAERADVLSAVWCGKPWLQTEDFRRYPLDPPLSDAGVEVAKGVAKRLRAAFQKAEGSMTIVVSSPYYRCVQTATHIAKELRTGILIDRSLGEIYGPTVMGDFQPPDDHIRPPEDTFAYCQKHNVPIQRRCLGQWPVWPEQLRIAQRRYADRFLKYLHRSIVARRNFLIVTHADCVATALSMMPSQVDRSVQHVDYCGYFIAERYVASPRTSLRYRGGASGSHDAATEEAEQTSKVDSKGQSSRSVTTGTTSSSGSRVASERSGGTLKGAKSRLFPAEAAAISLELETTVVTAQPGVSGLVESLPTSSSPSLSRHGSNVFSGTEGLEAVAHCQSTNTPGSAHVTAHVSSKRTPGILKFELFGSNTTGGVSPKPSGSRRNSSEGVVVVGQPSEKSSSVPLSEVSRGWSVTKSGITAPLRNNGWSVPFQKRLTPLVRHSKYEFNYIEELLGALNSTAIGKEQVDPLTANRRYDTLKTESGNTPRTAGHRVNFSSNYASDNMTESSSQSTLLFGASEMSELDGEAIRVFAETQTGSIFNRTNSMKSITEQPGGETAETPTAQLRRNASRNSRNSRSSESSPNTPMAEISPGASSSPRRSLTNKKGPKGSAVQNHMQTGDLTRRPVRSTNHLVDEGVKDDDINWELDPDVPKEDTVVVKMPSNTLRAVDQGFSTDAGLRGLGKAEVQRAKVFAPAGHNEQRRHSAQAPPPKPLQALCSIDSSRLLQRRRPGLNGQAEESLNDSTPAAGHESAGAQNGQKISRVSL
mmetsp:Transcript_40506/g.73225  ORF Transcript_40506/g.73225 Transcript_40506/m.73225 type:complete len:825 (-) Transcript_40506:81-2555(-)